VIQIGIFWPAGLKENKMSVIKTKRTITCECGCNYGSCCGKKTVYLLWYWTGGDYAALYIDGVKILSLTDSAISALIEIFKAPDRIEELTEEEELLDPFKMQ
jgi:hypothetical protein